jgi:HPt (histidine-containing phosphotransfer) domain-containing protein
MHQRLLGKFLKNTDKQVAAILSAAAAGDANTVAGIAHTLKSAARSVGALALGELCQVLETAGRLGDAGKCGILTAGLATAHQEVVNKIKHHLGF